jgi:bacterioferritin-associated ferredoxin
VTVPARVRATSPLRQVLAEVRAGTASSLDEIAAHVGVSRDEASAMVDHWVRKGRLTVDDLGTACPSGGCGSCSSGHGGAPGCGSASPAERPTLLAISFRRPD